MVVSTYTSKILKDSQAVAALASNHYRLPYSEGMTIGDLYLHLKTLPDFAGATDV
jgi:hypothetical protein